MCIRKVTRTQILDYFLKMCTKKPKIHVHHFWLFFGKCVQKKRTRTPNLTIFRQMCTKKSTRTQILAIFWKMCTKTTYTYTKFDDFSANVYEKKVHVHKFWTIF